MYPAELKSAREKFTAIKKVAGTLKNVQTVVCPPFVFVGDLKKLAMGNRCTLGAQNAWIAKDGAYTGEVSPAMLASMGINYVIIGHSERRELGETDELINKKVVAGVKAGLMVVLCVGERERDVDGEYLKYIANQIRLALVGVSKKDLSNLIVAYEPIWAIGKNATHSATADDALEVSILIKRSLSYLYGKEGSAVPVLYGGSVDAKNGADILEKSQIAGLLVGRASLDPAVFGEILRGVEKIKQ